MVVRGTPVKAALLVALSVTSPDTAVVIANLGPLPVAFERRNLPSHVSLGLAVQALIRVGFMSNAGFVAMPLKMPVGRLRPILPYVAHVVWRRGNTSKLNLRSCDRVLFREARLGSTAPRGCAPNRVIRGVRR